jgi:hypothetical protein
MSITYGTLTNYSKGDFGLFFPVSDFVEEFAFINDCAVDATKAFGLAEILIPQQILREFGQWTSVAGLDSYNGDQAINLSLYYEVPVPTAVWLFGSGLLGLISMARRKKA